MQRIHNHSAEEFGSCHSVFEKVRQFFNNFGRIQRKAVAGDINYFFDFGRSKILRLSVFFDNFLFLHKIVLQLDIQHTVFVIFLKHYILWNNDLQRLKISYEKIFYKVLILVSIY